MEGLLIGPFSKKGIQEKMATAGIGANEANVEIADAALGDQSYPATGKSSGSQPLEKSSVDTNENTRQQKMSRSQR